MSRRKRTNGHAVPQSHQTPTTDRWLAEQQQALAATLEQGHTHLRESLSTLYSRSDMLLDDLRDTDGQLWSVIGGGSAVGADVLGGTVGFFTLFELQQAQGICRWLAKNNEFAINGHENRISYVVGTGHTYTVSARAGLSVTEQQIATVQRWIDEWTRINRWNERQQEIARRLDRDGEVFVRTFVGADGMTLLRFIEPMQVAPPAGDSVDRANSWGVRAEPRDVESIEGYWVDGQLVPADQVQHRKANVDATCKRGVPLFWPVRKNLRRAEVLLRNMGAVSEIQSAIALIRKHASATTAAVSTFRAAQAEFSRTNQTTGRTDHMTRYRPGTILDVPSGTDYEMPSQGIDASKFVQVLQAELRAIASRLVMPEFMLSSDASNANYSSTMVAEGPAVKMFERLQASQMAADLELIRQMLRSVGHRRGMPDVVDLVEITAVTPQLQARNRLEAVQVDQVLASLGVKSPQSIAADHDLDYEQEQSQIEAHKQAGHQAEPPAVPAPLAEDKGGANCGTGHGGFKPGNECGGGGSGGGGGVKHEGYPVHPRVAAAVEAATKDSPLVNVVALADDMLDSESSIDDADDISEAGEEYVKGFERLWSRTLRIAERYSTEVDNPQVIPEQDYAMESLLGWSRGGVKSTFTAAANASDADRSTIRSALTAAKNPRRVIRQLAKSDKPHLALLVPETYRAMRGSREWQQLVPLAAERLWEGYP